MPDEKQEDQGVFARAAKIVQGVVDESAKAMSNESTRIDNEQYELSDMVATMTRVANAGIAGATEMARIPLEESWPEKHLILGEYVSTVVRRMVNQAGKVAEAAANDVGGMAYTPRRWLESMTRLIDIAVAGGMDIAETLGAGPVGFQSQPIASPYYTVPDSTQSRELSWKDKPTRDAADDIIPDGQLSFDPPTLLPHNTQFRVLVNAAGLLSGVYKGEVHLSDGYDQPIQIEL